MRPLLGLFLLINRKRMDVFIQTLCLQEHLEICFTLHTDIVPNLLGYILRQAFFTDHLVPDILTRATAHDLYTPHRQRKYTRVLSSRCFVSKHTESS